MDSVPAIEGLPPRHVMHHVAVGTEQAGLLPQMRHPMLRALLYNPPTAVSKPVQHWKFMELHMPVECVQSKVGCVPDACNCRAGCVPVGRRTALSACAGGIAAMIGAGGVARAQSTMTPEVALQTLLDGNKRFVSKQLISFQEDLRELKRQTAGKQEPFAAVLSCADSRVPVELIFDQSIGRVFVTRVAGNVATAEIIASLEYGAVILGTRTIMVLAHSGCGAVSAAMDGKAVPGQISTLYRLIRPAVDQAKGNIVAAEKANALNQAALLRDASPVLADLVRQKQLSVAAGYYDLASGMVAVLG